MRLFALGVLTIVLLATGAAAQAPVRPFNLYLAGGASLPQDDMKDLYKLGYHGEGGLGIALGTGFEIVGRVAYHMFSPDKGDDEYDGGDFSALMYGADLKLTLGSAASPSALFILGGVGQAQMEIKDIEVTGHDPVTFDKETEMYWALGGGIQFGSTFIQARYVNIKLGDESEQGLSTSSGDDASDNLIYIPVSIGFRF